MSAKRQRLRGQVISRVENDQLPTSLPWNAFSMRRRRQKGDISVLQRDISQIAGFSQAGQFLGTAAPVALIGRLVCGIGQVKLHFASVDIATQHQPHFRPGQTITNSEYPNCSEVCHDGPFAPFLDRMTGPSCRRHAIGKVMNHPRQGLPVNDFGALGFAPSSGPKRYLRFWPIRPNPCVSGHFSKIPTLQAGDLIKEPGIAAKCLVAGNPAKSKLSRSINGFKHLPSQLVFRLKTILLRDPTFYGERHEGCRFCAEEGTTRTSAGRLGRDK